MFFPVPQNANALIQRTFQAHDAAEMLVLLDRAKAEIVAVAANAEFMGFDFGGGAAGAQFVASIYAADVATTQPDVSTLAFRVAEASDPETLQTIIDRENTAQGADNLIWSGSAVGGAGGKFMWIAIYEVGA